MISALLIRLGMRLDMTNAVLSFSILDKVLVALATVKLAAMMASSFASADPLLGSAWRDVTQNFVAPLCLLFLLRHCFAFVSSLEEEEEASETSTSLTSRREKEEEVGEAEQCGADTDDCDDLHFINASNGPHTACLGTEWMPASRGSQHTVSFSFSILDRVLVALATVKLAAMMASSFASADPLLGSARRDVTQKL
ncbi:Type II intron maturase [Musa troglodytarum]|uniref:Type II intron maturase n=1 Tax=Musa troglodytarum TaxID=320322 RepID=A0A9E7F0V0_9LILI|nr:Type II intron maturase [Musa troglodytarum]